MGFKLMQVKRLKNGIDEHLGIYLFLVIYHCELITYLPRENTSGCNDLCILFYEEQPLVVVCPFTLNDVELDEKITSFSCVPKSKRKQFQITKPTIIKVIIMCIL